MALQRSPDAAPVQQVAHRLSALSPLRAAPPAIGRIALAPQAALAESPAIASPNRQLPEPLMNHLHAAPVAIRLEALVAATALTLALLAGIDSLAMNQAAAASVAQAAVTQAA